MEILRQGFFECIPDDLIDVVFSFVPYHKKDWLHVKLTCKRFLCVSKKSFDPSIKNNLAIISACVNGWYDYVLELLKDSRVDPNVSMNSPLKYASKHGHLSIVKLLMQDSRIDPSYCGNDPLLKACENGHVDIVSELMKDERVDPSSSENLAFNIACRENHVMVVQQLVTDVRVKNGYCGLALSSRLGSKDVVKYLIQLPWVDPSERDNYALSMAVSYRSLDVVSALIKDKRVTDGIGYAQACQKAADRGFNDILQILLDNSTEHDIN